MILASEQANGNKGKEQGAGVQNNSQGTVVSFDEGRFAVIDTADKAYWYGYLFYGTILQTGRQSVDLSAALADGTHLVRFQEFMKCQPVRQPDAGQNGIFTVHLVSPRLLADLIRLHITADPRERTVFPGEVFTAHPALLRHFIRGLFDRRPVAGKINTGDMIKGTTVGFIGRMAQAIRNDTKTGEDDAGLSVSIAPQRDGTAYLHVEDEAIDAFGFYLYNDALTFNPTARDILATRLNQQDVDPALIKETSAPVARPVVTTAVKPPVTQEKPAVTSDKAPVRSVKDGETAYVAQTVQGVHTTSPQAPSVVELRRPAPVGQPDKLNARTTSVEQGPVAQEKPAVVAQATPTLSASAGQAPVTQAKPVVATAVEQVKLAKETKSLGQKETKIENNNLPASGGKGKEGVKEKKEVKMSQNNGATATAPVSVIEHAVNNNGSAALVSNANAAGNKGGRAKPGTPVRSATADYGRERDFVERTAAFSSQETVTFSAPQVLLERLRKEASVAGLSFEEFVTVALLHETIARTQARNEEFGLVVQLKL